MFLLKKENYGVELCPSSLLAVTEENFMFMSIYFLCPSFMNFVTAIIDEKLAVYFLCPNKCRIVL